MQLIRSDTGFLSRCNNFISRASWKDNRSIPTNTCMLHRPQTLSALQEDATGNPALFAASKSNVPASTSTVFFEGKKVTMGMCDKASFTL